ncbi:MAG: right-handed parallel beta-helix repeat-containing protein [Thermoplasmata archaeon]|nr:right-handed parallel beta-helix repeat-containing protein [Thermoplasmata archaeon]
MLKMALVMLISVLAALPVYFSPGEAISPVGVMTPGDGGNYTMDDLATLAPDAVEKTGGYYLVKGNITVTFPDTLSLRPGDVLKFDSSAHLNVRGRLLALGEEGDEIYLMPFNPLLSWGGMYIYSPNPQYTSVLKHTVIIGGDVSIFCESSRLTVTDSEISDFQRSGVEGREGSNITLLGTQIHDGGYYGVYLEDSALQMEGSTITNTSTGIKTARASLELKRCTLERNRNTGAYLFTTTASMQDTRFTENPSYNLLLSRSEVELEGCFMNSSIYNIYSLYSELIARNSTLRDTLKDAVHSIGGSLLVEGLVVKGAVQSAFDLNATEFVVRLCTIENVGHPPSGYPFSAFYMTVSRGEVSYTTIRDVGFAYLEMVRSSVQCWISRMEGAGRFSFALDLNSSVIVVESETSGPLLFRDSKSSVTYSRMYNITAVDSDTGQRVENLTLDLFLPGGEVRSFFGPEGEIRQVTLNITVESISGTAHLGDARGVLSSPGYIPASLTLEEGSPREITVELFREHPPPSLVVWEPGEGEVVTGTLTLRGEYQGAYPARSVEIRFDGGEWIPLKWSGNGSFNLTYNLSAVIPGPHRLEVRAYDGSLYTGVAVINITVMVMPLDSDGDGLPDYREEELGTSPFNPDTDDDGLPDGIEVDTSDGVATDPTNPDTDGDFLLDGMEDINRNGRVDKGETDPLDPDTDGDGIPDGKDPSPLEPEKKRSNVDFILWTEALLLAVLIVALLLVVIKRWRGR